MQTKEIKQESPASETKNSDQNNPATAEGNQDATASSLTALDGLDYTRSKLVSSSTVYEVLLQCNVMGAKDSVSLVFLGPRPKCVREANHLQLLNEVEQNIVICQWQADQ